MTRSLVPLVLLLQLWVYGSLGLNSWDMPKTEPWKLLTPELEQDWHNFKKAYNRTYSDVEEIHRRLYWEDTIKLVRSHNLKYAKGESSFMLGENDLSDLADDEYEKIYLTGLRLPADLVHPPGLSELDANVPKSKDWVKEGLVSPIKNQGRCGSCWAFASVVALEGQVKKNQGRMYDLSEQNLVDCANRRYGNYGCQGGWMANAFKYVRDDGIDMENCYPYTGTDYQGCRSSRCNSVAKDSGGQTVGRSEYSLQSAVGLQGPVAIAVDVSGWAFRNYRYGVLDDNQCSPDRPNHAMAVVGYGTSNGRDYWTVKNSWGTTWGDKGYVYMSRNRGNQCGIANFAVYPQNVRQ